MRHRNIAASLTLLLAAGRTLGQDTSLLLGKSLPKLELSHALQGNAWSQDALLGSVVVLDVFQLG